MIAPKENSDFRAGMRKFAGVWALAALAVVVGLVLNSSSHAAESAPAPKLPQRVIYFGDLNSARAKDFLDFLKIHFAAVESGKLDPFEPKASEGYDVAILDYGELKLSNNRIEMPGVPVRREFARPTITIGATGALVSDRLGLKTGYL